MQTLGSALRSAAWQNPYSGLVSFLVSLDDAICVVGECEFLQCTVLGKHGAVSDDATLRGRDVIFFLNQAQILSR